ncbi:MAG: ATP-binding cassette domain-containing protein [Alloprevotella sp.]|nr:ATP-binding cassette domain-containing protein [Alloprevotella sp.]MBR1652785.1 ATP-binding cassette domain-containing protein [Alloprevotella sp.]
MNTISLQNTLPEVFAARTDVRSDVWRQELTFEKGRSYLVEAQSGTGKSSLCSYLTGQRRDYQGTILFDGHDIRSLGVSDWVETRQKHLSHMYQELRLFPELTAMENVQIKNRLTAWKEERDINAWFDALGIGDKKGAKVGRMSFGQQQRVALIRALVQPFDFLILDEPISHLDDENARTMAEILLAEVGKQEAGLIVTSIGKHMDIAYDEVLHL